MQEFVFQAIFNSYNLESIKELSSKDSEWLKDKTDLRTDYDLMVKIETKLVYFLNKLNIYSPFIQFPVNLRILFPQKPIGYESKAYNVDAIHCDHWSGSPLDSTNCFLYLYAEKNSPILNFYTYEESESNLVKDYRGNYQNAPEINYSIRKTLIPKTGVINIWQCTVPHNIFRNKSGVTISIDFRIRNNSVIFKNDLRRDINKYWLNSKMGSLGLYWIKNKKPPKDFKEKICFELNEASMNYEEEYLDIRKKYINKFYG